MILYCIRAPQGYARRKDGALHWTTLEQASVFSPDRSGDLKALWTLARAEAPEARVRLLRVIEEPCPDPDLPCGW